MIKINSRSKQSRIITCIKESPFKVYVLGGWGGKGSKMGRLYVFVECALCLQSLFQQNKMKFLLGKKSAISPEILREVTRNRESGIYIKLKEHQTLILPA